MYIAVCSEWNENLKPGGNIFSKDDQGYSVNSNVVYLTNNSNNNNNNNYDNKNNTVRS